MPADQSFAATGNHSFGRRVGIDYVTLRIEHKHRVGNALDKDVHGDRYQVEQLEPDIAKCDDRA